MYHPSVDGSAFRQNIFGAKNKFRRVDQVPYTAYPAADILDNFRRRANIHRKVNPLDNPPPGKYSFHRRRASSPPPGKDIHRRVHPPATRPFLNAEVHIYPAVKIHGPETPPPGTH